MEDLGGGPGRGGVRPETGGPVSTDDDEPGEPVFKRSTWGTNHYVYNTANPVGAVLTGLTVILAAVLFYLMGNHIGPFALPSHSHDRDGGPTPTESPWTWEQPQPDGADQP